MKNLQVSKKLFVGFMIVVMLTIIVGAAGIYGLTTMGNNADKIYYEKTLPLGDLTKADEYFLISRIQARSAIIYTGDSEKLVSVEREINNCLDNFNTLMTNYYPSIVTDEGLRLYNLIMNNYETFKPAILQVLSHAKEGKPQQELLKEMESTLDSTNAIASGLSDIIQVRMNVMKKSNDENNALQHFLLIVIIAIIAASAVISIGLALYISGLISKPLKLLSTFMSKAAKTGEIILSDSEMINIRKIAQLKDETGQCIAATVEFITHIVHIGRVLEKVTDGDLTVEFAALSDKDVIGVSLKKMVSSLNSMFNEISASTMQVSSGSKQIADGAQSLAQGSTEQASAVEELRASIGEIANQTADNANIARQAARLSASIKDNAEAGSLKMEQMMQAVKEINDASESIGKVIDVIDNIAFQTNILALNASVEAARAGSAGKGFAVVADEVRSLAAKSAEAAKDTGSLIENSIAKANLGLSIATETSASLKEIVEGIIDSSKIIEKITSSSDAQAEAIAQINTGIEQVTQVVNQVSATAEESAAASEEMNGQSEVLEHLISQFKLKEASRPAILSSNLKTLYDPKPASDFTVNEGYGKY